MKISQKEAITLLESGKAGNKSFVWADGVVYGRPTRISLSSNIFLTPFVIGFGDSKSHCRPISTIRALLIPHNNANPRPFKNAVPSDKTPIPIPSISFCLSINKFNCPLIGFDGSFDGNDLIVMGFLVIGFTSDLATSSILVANR